MDAKLFYNTHTLRASVLAGLSLFLTVLALFFCLFNLFYSHTYLLAGMQFLFACYSGYIHALARTKRQTHHQIQQYVYLLIFTIGVTSYLQPLANGFFLWTIFCPILLYALLGLSHGRKMTGVVLVIQLFNVYQNSEKVAEYETLAILVNLTLCYCGIWLVSHIYEYNRRNIENSLTYLASRDALTGAHNRLALTTAFRHFEQHKDLDSTLWLLILDLDYFKQINDQYGHDTGDKVLIDTSHLLSEVVGDNNLYRIGGEEFCVTLFDQDLNDAERVGEALRREMNNHLFCCGDKRIGLTLSIGICEYRHGDKLSDLLKLADVELYRAKKSGRNQVRICQATPQNDFAVQSESA